MGERWVASEMGLKGSAAMSVVAPLEHPRGAHEADELDQAQCTQGTQRAQLTEVLLSAARPARMYTTRTANTQCSTVSKKRTQI
jgi:hypothetical protein